MRAFTIHFGFILFFAGIAELAVGGEAAIDAGWLEKARREIPRALEKYQSLGTRIEEESEYRYAVGPGASIGKGPFNPGTRRDRIVRLGENVIHEKTETDDKAPKLARIILDCVNSDYSFTLTKSKADSAFVLGRVVPAKAKLPITAQGGFGLHVGMVGYLRASLDAVEGKPKYSLKRLGFDGAKGLLRIGFTFGENEFEEGIYIDTANGWRVSERRVETKFLVATDEYTYGVTIEGMSFPTGLRNLSVYKVEEAPPNMEITAKLISIKLTDKEPYDFRMSAFGLPEPMGMPAVSRATRWHVWLSLAAVGVLVGGGIVLMLKRRYAKIPAAPAATPEVKEGGS
jgi:hypothetical protein